MRIVLLSVLLFACNDKDSGSHIDASVKLIDAPKVIDAPNVPMDAPPDAPPDAAPMNVVTACMHACDAIAACIMEPSGDPDCYAGCQADLADCTAQQVATIDACSTEMCGDLKNDMSPLLDCIIAVSCVDMAVTDLRK